MQDLGLKSFDARATVIYFTRSTITNAQAAERKEITRTESLTNGSLCFSSWQT